jgi:uncharacterized membrane protein
VTAPPVAGPPVADPPIASPRVAGRRIVRHPLGLAGTATAVLFYCASLTPSLLPRAWYLQGIVSGVTAAMGYGVGATLGALVRVIWRRRYSRATRIAWWTLIVVAPVLGLLFLALGTGWQQDLRARLAMDPLVTYDIVRITAVSLLTFVVLLLIARGLRLGTRRLFRLLRRWIPRPIAYGVALAVVVYVVVGFAQGFLASNLLTVADRTASLANGKTTPGIVAPESALRSAGPGSAVPWRTLGKQGRDFVSGGPTWGRLSQFAGRTAREPIRLYAGLDSAGSVEERARLVVREMDRTGAFDRAVIAVITPTGTGWVDSDVTDSLEFMYAGDTALVSMQYSYLPSWISFMVDRSKVSGAATALIGAVHARWAALPVATRPKLLLFGESLGSFGTEMASGNLRSLTDSADGVLLVGPPFANPIRRDLIGTREPSSPIWDPLYRSDPVEFTANPTDLRTASAPKVVYLQNSSDPIVWWSPTLLLQRPDWLDDPRGPDVSPYMHWYPGITFWQTAVDQVFATGVPAGHGHVYGSSVVEGWAALAAPEDWTTADTVRLRALLDNRSER